MPAEFEEMRRQDRDHAAEGKKLTGWGSKCMELPWREWRPATRKRNGAGGRKMEGRKSGRGDKRKKRGVRMKGG